MDPNANLESQRRLVHKLLNPSCDGDTLDEDDVLYLAELVESLDEWLCNGGFLPEDWGGARDERGT